MVAWTRKGDGPRLKRTPLGEQPEGELLQQVYRWLFVPRSVWPIDIGGLCAHLLDCVAEGKKADRRARFLCSFLQEPPSDAVCATIAEHERAVKAGNYETLI